MKRRAFAACVLGMISMSLSARAADLPANFQSLFLLRILAYDRNLKTRAGDAVSILVIYQDGNDASDAMKGEIVRAVTKVAKDTQVSGLPVRISAVAYADATGLDAAITSAKASALYLCPGLDASLGAIADVTHRRSVLSFTGVEPWVTKSVAIGLVARESKPAVIVNLAASKAEGADLDPALLRLAEVIR
jgi:YfiR/HmsC-like